MIHPTNREERRILREKKQAKRNNASKIRRLLKDRIHDQETKDVLQKVRDGKPADLLV